MNGLFAYSSISLASSSLPSSVLFLDTTTSYERGIGSTSGRAIYGLGAAMKRGIERLAISRALRMIDDFFPHRIDSSKKGIETAYDYILELSRPGLYRVQVRKPALGALLLQIFTGQTQHLIRSLTRWPSVEISIFLSEVMTCMPQQWLPPNTVSHEMHRELMDIYLASSSVKESPMSRLIKFIIDLSQVDSSTRQAVLDSGFLFMLICMSTASPSSNMELALVNNLHNFHEEGTNAIISLCQYSDAKTVISTHPICILWPPDNTLIPILGNHMSERASQWRQLGSNMIMRRVIFLAKILRRVGEGSSLFRTFPDIYVDLLEFSRPDLYSINIQEQALESILVQIATRQTRHLHQLLMQWSSADLKPFASKIIACMLIGWRTQDDNNHHRLQNAYLACVGFEEAYRASALVDFLVSLSQVHHSARQAVLHSGFLDILLCMYTCADIQFGATHRVDLIQLRVYEAGNMALGLLGVSPDAQKYISAHPISILWPANRKSQTVFGEKTLPRPEQWRLLGPLAVSRRLDFLRQVLYMCVRDAQVLSGINLKDAYMDLVEFSTTTSYSADTVQVARPLIHICKHLKHGKLPRKPNQILNDLPHVDHDILRNLHASGERKEWHISARMAALRSATTLSLGFYDAFGGKPPTNIWLTDLSKLTLNGVRASVIEDFFKFSYTPLLEYLAILNVAFTPKIKTLSIPFIPTLQTIVLVSVDLGFVLDFFSIWRKALPEVSNPEDIPLPRLSTLCLALVGRNPLYPIVNKQGPPINEDLIPIYEDCFNLCIKCVNAFDYRTIEAFGDVYPVGGRDRWVCPRLTGLELHEYTAENVPILLANLRRMVAARRIASAQPDVPVHAFRKLIVHAPIGIQHEEKKWFMENLELFVWDTVLTCKPVLSVQA